MWDWVPAANLALGVVALICLLLRTSGRLGEMPHEVTLLHLLAVLLLFGLLTVSARQVTTGDASYDVIVITVVKTSALAILWRTRNTLYRTGVRHLSGDDAANQDSAHPDRDIEA